MKGRRRVDSPPTHRSRISLLSLGIPGSRFRQRNQAVVAASTMPPTGRSLRDRNSPPSCNIKVAKSCPPTCEFQPVVRWLRGGGNAPPSTCFAKTSASGIYRVFRNLRDPLRELIVMLPRNNEKKSYKYMCHLSSFMRCNEFSVLITFTKDARNDHVAFEDKPARVLSFV